MSSLLRSHLVSEAHVALVKLRLAKMASYENKDWILKQQHSPRRYIQSSRGGGHGGSGVAGLTSRRSFSTGGHTGGPTGGFTLGGLAITMPETRKLGLFLPGISLNKEFTLSDARVFVLVDTAYRYLQYIGYDVSYIRCVHDINERIIMESEQNHESWLFVKDRYSEKLRSTLTALQCVAPTHEPYIGDHIDDIRETIAMMICEGFVSRESGFDDLHINTLESPISHLFRNSRYRSAVHNSVIWEKCDEGETPCWDSDWGIGRPGPNVGSAVMGQKYLGQVWDIYVQTKDTTWRHAIDMATLIGYFDTSHTTIRSSLVCAPIDTLDGVQDCITEVLDLYGGIVSRYFLLSTNYWSRVSCSLRQLDEAVIQVLFIFKTLKRAGDFLNKLGAAPADDERLSHGNDMYCSFKNAMSCDLRTATALRCIRTDLKEVNFILDGPKVDQEEVDVLYGLKMAAENLLSVLGLLPPCYDEAISELKEKCLRRAGFDESMLLQCIQKREEYMTLKDYEAANEIRERLRVYGIFISDNKDGSMTWEPGLPKVGESDFHS